MRPLVFALLAVLVFAAIGVGVIRVINVQAQTLPTLHSTQSAAPTKQASFTLESFPFDPYEDPDFINAHVNGQTLNGEPYPTKMGDNADWVKYWPTTNIVVPAHTLVTVTILNWDSATPLLNPYYAIPRGTVGSTMLVNGKPTTATDPTTISHTFTIHGIPQDKQPWLFVSVPVVGVADDAKTDAAGMPLQPMTMQFSFMTSGPGKYIWQCFDPCGSNYNGFGGPMETKGYMSGTVTVV